MRARDAEERRDSGSGARVNARGSNAPLRVLVVGLVAIGVIVVAMVIAQPRRPTAAFDPPVLAGQQLWGYCAGGFYARKGDTIVLTSSGHCAGEGTVAHDPDGRIVRGVFGPAARAPSCPHAGKTCKASDMNYMVVAEDRIPWGRLNQVDLGSGGYRTIVEGARPLRCEDIRVGDEIEINGRNAYRKGTVAERGEYLHADDGDYFPCMIAARIPVDTGDSGGAVLVRGTAGGVTSRSFGGLLGFTPLAEGLAQLGLELCATPDCDLAVPGAPSSR